MRSCEEYEELVSALVDGVLPEEDRGGLMEHMAQCPACQAYFNGLIAIHDVLSTIEEAPEGFSAGVMELVRQTPQETNKVIRPRSWRRWAAVAACCAVALLGVWRLSSAAKDALISTDAISCQSAANGAVPRCAADGEEGFQPALADAGGLEAEDSLEKEEGLLVRDGALPDFFSQMPEQFTCPDCGAALSVAADGAFSGTLADGTQFSGVFSELEEAGTCVYTAAASSISLEAVPEGTSFRLEEGAVFLIYLPGADVQSLPEAFSGFDGQDTLPCWGVYFPAEEMAFTCSQP